MRKSLLILGLAILLGSGSAAWSTPVNSELLLMVDVSDDITLEEFDLLMDGYSQVFHSRNLGRSLAYTQGIAVALAFWAGPDQQELAIDWMYLHDPVSTRAFADAIDAIPHRPGFADMTTSISDALDWTARVDIFDNEFEGDRRIIDISGEGENEADPGGLTLPEARDRALGGADAINAIVLGPPAGTGFSDYDDLVRSGPVPGMLYVFGAYDFDFPYALEAKVIQELPVGIIPEPGTIGLALLGAAMLGVGLRRRRRRR